MDEEKGREATLQIVCLDELVRADDRYRRLDGLVDWGFVHYGADWGSRRVRRKPALNCPSCSSVNRARVFCREGATGLRPDTQRLNMHSLGRAYADVRSPNNLRTRCEFARPCTGPGASPMFVTADLPRTIGGGVQRQLLLLLQPRR